MRIKVFENVFLVAMLVFISTMILTLAVEYRFVSSEQEKEFRDQAEYLCIALDNVGTDQLRYLESTKEIRLRVTLIDRDGTVLYDSQEEETQLQNHLEREEIALALKNGSGECKRYSDTLSKMTYYYAKQLDNGQIIRIGQECFTLTQLAVRLLYPMTVILVLVLVVAWWIAVRISRKIAAPIDAIDPAQPEVSNTYSELQPLVRRIRDQNRLLYEQMNELKEEHEKQDTMRREFTANVSHELKTPLTSISGYAEIIAAGMVEEKDVKRFANTIHNEAQRLITLVGDIIRLSQLDDRDESLTTREPFDLYDTAEEMISVLADAAQKKSVSVSLTGTHETIVGSAKIVGEMIYNLIDNAIKYNNEGGTVQICVGKQDDTVTVSVRDNGIGIPRAELERVFERFYRVDKSHSREIGGTGLGLSIVKHGAAYHNATVSLDSELGMGTRVTLSFPKPDEPKESV